MLPAEVSQTTSPGVNLGLGTAELLGGVLDKGAPQ